MKVLVRRVRMNAVVPISSEEILAAAAAESASRGLTPLEVLVLWVRNKTAVVLFNEPG